MTNATGERNLSLIQEVLEVFPETARKERRKHMMVSDPQMESVGKCIISNRKSQPGVMTVRGCAYAGSKGVVFGPIKDMAHISHGPVGCGQYSRAGRRNYYTGVSGVDSFGTLNFTSDFQERDIVFGGDKKLSKLIEEMELLFPLTKGITIQSECPVGLIGDDISAVANASSKALDKPVIPVRCEGFRGVSQSLGHHIANDVVRDWILNNREGQPFETTPYDVAIIGDYNIGGDAWASRILLEEMGLRVVAQWSGDGTLVEMENTPFVKLNLVHCYRSMNYIARHMEEKHQIPWMEYNFFGPTKIAESLRKIADQFDDTIRANAEAVIARYEGQMAAIIAKYRPRLEGRKVLLYMGGLRPRHVIGAYEDLGMEIIAAGYEFAHNDDYDRTLPDLKEGTLLFDDASSYELEAFVKALKPDLIGSGIKEKYIFQKMGVPFRQMHSWDYSGPYHGYDGFAIFARDMDMTLNNPAWNELTAPWLKSA
ncbi:MULTISPECIES: nitrogenase molybdenum-iron protein alpha chain [Klebsiella]|uniref:nitrogenase molybdenum-iron protein alpha chain n=1 Tax=Klebsiella TaxID=570 RepID=UPI0012B906DF|nr:nitrogenase molybdenum-iron protein alpha chain [Klebsiella michiganensis]ELT9726251.1 nitrogenase molybdenum-iron protein alpha chain [Klebsiella michiganensis]MCW9639872.1 nitrogenase molybdenum-iron protein alpha chain [Klebsiella michiganensis]MDH0490866.1 nitrogenase molybdenum-iron protein alpha chain [Klebsiella michiganensis]MDM4109873.1 nitrogenase molybdenum-iron protein alpha chain [Klebsiella michiganensis]MDM4343735.1 nitrogenase molybdenum-iron protein alpha chain [Klebsiella 